MSPFLKRAAVLAAVALALGACEFGLGLPEEAVAPGSTVTVTNADGDTCPLPEAEPQAVGDPDEENGSPVLGFLVTDVTEGEPEPFLDSFTDAEGIFTSEVTAPDRPGLHLLFAVCGEDAEQPELTPEAINEDGAYVDFLHVTYPTLTIDLSDDEVEEGDTVTATFPACQDGNDLGFSSTGGIEGVGAMAEPTQEEINTDYPDLQVFLDGELVDTVEGTERYPTDEIEVPVTLEDEGEHEISGVCTYQTFEIDEALFEECFENEGECPVDETEPTGVGTAAIDYPYSPDGQGVYSYDEATSEAAASVTVLAVAVAPTDQGAVPVPAQPNFTG